VELTPKQQQLSRIADLADRRMRIMAVGIGTEFIRLSSPEDWEELAPIVVGDFSDAVAMAKSAYAHYQTSLKTRKGKAPAK
jgi:hypothetical protein